MRSPVALSPAATSPSKPATPRNVVSRRTLSWVRRASTIWEASVRFQIRS